MSFQKEHGHIGTSDIENAKQIFRDRYMSGDEIVYDDKSIYIQKMNNLVKGEEFDDVEDLISDDEAWLDHFSSLEEYIAEMAEMAEDNEDYNIDDDESEIVDLLRDGGEAYVVYRCGNEYVSHEKESIIFEAIRDGEQRCYTLDEAWKNLNGEISWMGVDESLVIWLLK